jgi:hypothetical protein
MQSGQHDYIRDLYRRLTDIGEEADNTVDARFVAEQKSTVKKTAAPAVKVTPPPPPGAAPRARPQVVTPAPRQSVQSAQATSLSVRNPFSVVGVALQAIKERFAAAFWLGAIFILAFGLASTVIIGSNVQAGRVVAERGPLLPIVLAGVTYLLCWWIRMGNNPRGTPFTGAVRFSDAVTAVAIGLAAAVVLPVIRNADGAPNWLKSAAEVTLWWPLHGPYASMVWERLISEAPATTFWEPFMHAVVLIATFPLVPFIVRDPARRGVKLLHLLVRAPLLIAALALCTLPIAVLTATISGLTLELLNAQNIFASSLIMAAIFYVQLVLSAVTIGEFYRRVSLSHP